MRRTLDDTHLPYRTADEHLFRRSLREIRQYATETPEALIVPGHDWEAWQELDSGLLNQVARLGRGGDVDRPGSRTQAIRSSDCRRSSMYWKATAWVRLA